MNTTVVNTESTAVVVNEIDAIDSEKETTVASKKLPQNWMANEIAYLFT